MIKPGMMRHRIRIQQRITLQDGSGDNTNTWSDFAIRWSSVEPLTGREAFASQVREGLVSTRFRLRFLSGVSPAMRILWTIAGVLKIFNITEVQLIQGVKHEMVLMATELVGETS